MEGAGGGRQSRLLGRLLGKLRGEHHHNSLDKRFSASTTTSCTSETMPCVTDPRAPSEEPHSTVTLTEDRAGEPETTDLEPPLDATQFAANIDLRYGGQYLSPDQLPEFCDQLHHLVEVIRNIHSYAKITGEYPSELERRLEREAREVASLAAEARNARDVVARARAQSRAVRSMRKQIVAQLATLRETEVRELESSIRLSDRKLYKSWETLKDSTDPAAFEPLLDEVRNKQTALDNLVRLIDNRRSNLSRSTASPTPLPPPEPHDSDDLSSVPGSRKRFEGTRRSCKRKRATSREPRSVNLAAMDSPRVGSAGAVALTPLELPSRGSVRDILFFSVN